MNQGISKHVAASWVADTLPIMLGKYLKLARELDIIIIISAGNVPNPEISDFNSRDELMSQCRNQLFQPERSGQPLCGEYRQDPLRPRLQRAVYGRRERGAEERFHRSFHLLLSQFAFLRRWRQCQHHPVLCGKDNR